MRWVGIVVVVGLAGCRRHPSAAAGDAAADVQAAKAAALGAADAGVEVPSPSPSAAAEAASASPAPSAAASAAPAALAPAVVAPPRVTFAARAVREQGERWPLDADVALGGLGSGATATLQFQFTETAVFERNLVDGQAGPVTERRVVTGKSAQVVTATVHRPGGRVRIEPARRQGFEAGEYRVTLRLADGPTVGSPQSLSLNGDNPITDRRSIVFKAH